MVDAQLYCCLYYYWAYEMKITQIASEDPQSSPTRADQAFHTGTTDTVEYGTAYLGENTAEQTLATTDHTSRLPHIDGGRPSSEYHSLHVAPVPSSESTVFYHSYPPPHHHPYPVQAYGMLPTAPPHSTSFESHGRSPSKYSPSFTPYSYPLPPHPYHYYPWAPPPPPIEYISNIKPNDVLSGRGGATNCHSGNRTFRKLVKDYQDSYLRAKKRDKPAVASIIVEKIRDSGGRFLRRVDTTTQGQVALYFDIGDDRAKEKTCQALREGAPEIRKKKRKGVSGDEEDTNRPGYNGESDEMLLSSSIIDRSVSVEGGVQGRGDERKTSNGRNAVQVDNENTPGAAHYYFPKDGPIMIRPSAALLRRRTPDAISVDQLESHERELYLRDFLPPDPLIRKKKGNSHFLVATAHAFQSSGRDENVGPWPVVQV